MMTMAQSGSQSQLNLVASRYLDVLGSNLPIDERVSLSKLSPSDVPVWADARIEEYNARLEDYWKRIKEMEGYIATFGSLRNTQSPIHVLPSELLVKIFVHACTTWRELRIARVCRHWHAVITSTPHVWANAIESELPHHDLTANQFLRVALEKSGSLPLTLAPVHSFYMAWKILSPHSFRLVSLTVHSQEDGQADTLAKALSSSSLLNLRTLRVEVTYRSRLMQPARLSLDSRYLPQLRELYINGVLLTSSSTVSTLEDLTIIGEVRDPWHVLGRVLQRCVALKTLTLLSTMPATWEDDADSYDADLQAVSLPQLRRLALRDEADLLRIMLRCLHIPSSTPVSIVMLMDDCDSKTFLDAVPDDYMQRFHTQPPIDRLHFIGDHWLSSTYTTARCYAGCQERLHTAAYLYEERDLHGFLEPLFGACEHGALHTLVIDIMETRLQLTSWDPLFQRLPHLRRLELFGRTAHIGRVHFAATFLRNCGNHHPDTGSSGLTLAWVVPGDADEADVLLGLDALASVLEDAITPCARLELYAAKPSKKQQEFQSLAAIPTDPDLFRTVAAPILPRLASLVDILTIH